MTSLTIDTRMLFSSGIGSYLSHLLPEIIPALQDYRISLLCDIEKVKARNYAWLQQDNVRLINCRSNIYSLSEQFELVRVIPPGSDLFWSPHYNIPLLYRGVQVTTVHDVFHIAEENEDRSFFKNLYARTMFTKAMKKSTLVFVDSEFTRSEMEKYGLPCLDRVKVVHIGANYKPRRTVNEAAEASGRHLLFVGNIKPHKNLKRLVAACEILHEKYGVSQPLVIVGESEGLKTGMPGFREEISESSRGQFIRFAGRVSDDDLHRLYKDASLLILPSLYEGFGLPALEAMAFGCPAVVSRAGSLPEICGDAALYVDPLNVEDIAEKMYLALSDKSLRTDLIRCGFDRLKLYDWKKTAFEYIQYFRSIF